MTLDFGINNSPTIVQAESTINNQSVNKEEDRSKVTREEIEQKFKEIFENHNLEFSFEILQKKFGDEYSLENLLKCDVATLDNLIKDLEAAFLNAESDESKTERAQTLEEFFAKYPHDENGNVNFNSVELDKLKAELKSILGKMSDDEKCKYSNTIAENFKNQPSLIQTFFESFSKENKDKRTSCADSIIGIINDKSRASKSNIMTEYKNVEIIATRYTSTEKGNKAHEDCSIELYNFEHNPDNKIVLDKYYKNNVPLDQLSKEEQAIIRKYEELSAFGTEIVKSILSNENYNEEDVKQFLNRANNFYKETYVYNSFLENIASFISDSQNQLNISRKKIANILDEISDNKFSETVQKMSERTSTDEKTGGFKNDAEVCAQTASQKANELKQTIVNNTPKEDRTFVVEKDDTTKVSADVQKSKLEQEPAAKEEPSFFEKYSASFIQEAITGKNNTFKSFEKAFIIEGYKRLQEAMKIDLLQKVTGNLAGTVISATKESTLAKFIESGKKAPTVFLTNRIEEALKNKQEG